MKILIINHGFIENDPVIIKLLVSLKEKKINYLALGIMNDSKDYVSRPELNIINIELKSKSYSKRFNIFRKIIIILEWRHNVRKYLRRYKPDLIQVVNHLSLWTLLMTSIKHQRGLIYDANELESKMNGMTKLKQLMVRLLEYFLWNKIDVVFLGNNSVADWYKNNYKPKKIIEIYGSPKINENKLTQNFRKQDIRLIFNIPKDVLVFVISGKVYKGRHIPLVLDVFIKSDLQSHLVLIGLDLPEDVIYIIDNNSKIHYVPFLSSDIYNDILKSADIGICLIENTCKSYYLSLPQKFFEYAFAGLDIISSKYPEMERLTREFGLGLSIISTFDELYIAVTNYESKEFVKKNRDLSDYSWENQFSKILFTYNDLMRKLP